MIPTERQLSTKATTDSFDEIYTNFDLSVNDAYRPDMGYPFDYPTRWLNDPSMNKRIAIRRLDVTPSSHSFTLRISVDTKSEHNSVDAFPVTWEKHSTVDITEYDNLFKVMNAMCNLYQYNLKEYDASSVALTGQLYYEYDNKTNTLKLKFKDTNGVDRDFALDGIEDDHFAGRDDYVEDFLRFLNQGDVAYGMKILKNMSKEKVFYDVWNRDRLHFHATFSTSRRHFIGKRGDFYQNLTLLYPAPTNESTFFIRFTSNGTRNILIRYCEFDIQLCFIVNYRKATIL